MPEYECYGLLLRSELDLPGLPRSERNPPPPASEVTVELRSLPASPAADLVMVRPGRLWVGSAVMRLHIEGVATYEVRDGRHVVVDATPAAHPDEVRLFLLGTCLGAVLQQRRMLVLHGNAVRIDDGCAVVLGRTGAGKSTVSAEFVRRGLDLLADDVVPVDHLLRALPGFPRIKLWSDAADRLGIDVSGLRRVRPEDAKYDVPVGRGPLGPLPVRWVYVLESSEEPLLRLETARGLARFDVLREHTYRSGLLQGPARAHHLERCHTLQEQVRLVRVLRPEHTMTPAATAEAILDDIACHRSGPVQQHQQPQEAR
ncbi:MAG: HPr serine kinase protein [Marmoricola sp.]|nr:HPr serine kinase protein [Marmoricola sp.]